MLTTHASLSNHSEGFLNCRCNPNTLLLKKTKKTTVTLIHTFLIIFANSQPHSNQTEKTVCVVCMVLKMCIGTYSLTLCEYLYIGKSA